MKVTVCDVGPRDGLQNESRTLAPATRAELVNRLSAAGLPRIEAVSFVNPARVPAMAGPEEVVEGIVRRDGVDLAGLVLNERGYDRLRSSDLDQVHVNFAATDSFSQRNANATVDEALAGTARILARARADGVRSTVSISVAFGCPFDGAVPAERVLGYAEEAVTLGADEVVFADTIGVATPTQVRHVVVEAVKWARPVGVHLHNTRSTGFANAWAALEWGATLFDASVGGLGGCPFAPKATGNIATEDLVYLLHGEGVETGIDLDGLIGVAEWLEGVLGRQLPGQVYRAGTFAPVG
ncbi:MAG: hydroxymethylglutaryl-CoA lyase [Actinobacteria bacterium]|nr:hydroxymethylglutaryl-CoA lyase [Actinomycetota bacterium]